MPTSEIISQVLNFTDNIPASDGDYAARRERLTNYLTEVVAEVWYEREWPFARRTTVITVSAPNGYAIAPADFLKLGEYGTVLLEDQFVDDPLDNEPEYIVERARKTNVRTSTPAFFSIYGQDPATNLPLFQFPYNDTDFDIRVNYIKTAPVVEDGGSNDAAIEEIPIQYHQRMLVPGLQARSLQSKGDAGWNVYQGRFTEALEEMKIQERRRQGTIWQLPSFFGRSRSRGA